MNNFVFAISFRVLCVLPHECDINSELNCLCECCTISSLANFSVPHPSRGTTNGSVRSLGIRWGIQLESGPTIGIIYIRLLLPTDTSLQLLSFS